jgi:hypothetical protein
MLLTQNALTALLILHRMLCVFGRLPALQQDTLDVPAATALLTCCHCFCAAAPKADRRAFTAAAKVGGMWSRPPTQAGNSFHARADQLPSLEALSAKLPKGAALKKTWQLALTAVESQ